MCVIRECAAPARAPFLAPFSSREYKYSEAAAACNRRGASGELAVKKKKLTWKIAGDSFRCVGFGIFGKRYF